MKTGNQIRQEFISFFEHKSHRFVRSSPVVPIDDPTLLFTNAGMNQFKPIFLGEENPKSKRAVNSQKCIRVSGKHNDLEEVGIDNYHHTFFEMLGNWSFGDYYKAEAIKWAWELLTEVWGMDKERLWVTIYKNDDEAGALWAGETDIDPSRILKFGEKDNFWEMGETGPCGPCSEIHYYNGHDISKMTAEGVNDLPEYREIWNLVFIQYNRSEDGTLHDLPATHVDTGAGLERIVGILQGVESNYATDLFMPIIDKIAELTNINYTGDDGVAHQVLADHIRMLAFSIADGALPGNEGRGYVLRRILRRAARFGRQLGQHEPFIFKLVPTLVEVMGEAYPELREKQTHIEKVIQAEEQAFGVTLDRGLEVFDQITAHFDKIDVPFDKVGTIPGTDAFKLYDTYGFPLDLTELMARERGLTVDTAGFEKEMAAQRERARKGGKAISTEAKGDWITVTAGAGTTFLGYEKTSSKAAIRKYRRFGQGEIEITLDQTPFYAESGGQVGDKGKFVIGGGAVEIFDTVKEFVEGHEEIIHRGTIQNGLEKATEVFAAVDADLRRLTRLNHTATHLMHAALRAVIGDHVQQAGSLVSPDKLRFDLTHYEKITDEQLAEIERLVHDEIIKTVVVKTTVMDYDNAKKSGAIALFGEKYGDDVRVVEVPGFSKELCGGTHVDNTADIGDFKIISESALGAGIRRIEALTGAAVVQHLDHEVEELAHSINAVNSDIQSDAKNNGIEVDATADNDPNWAAPSDGTLHENHAAYRARVQALKSQLLELQAMAKDLRRRIKDLSKTRSEDLVGELVGQAKTVAGVKVLSALVQIVDKDQFKDTAVDLKHRLKSAIVVLGTVNENKPSLVAAVTDDLKQIIPAGDLVKELGKIMGGGGGGSPIIATAGGKDASKLQAAIDAVVEVVQSKLA